MQLFLAFLVALSLTAVLIPPLARWAPTLGLYDRPNARKVHSTPVPRVGGLAMAIGMLVPLGVALEALPALRGLVAGIVVLLAFGVWDDRVELGYRAKLAGQLLAALALVYFGDIRIESLTLVTRESLPGAVSLPLTLLFIVGVTNAVNLSDGLDGLAGGMALLCLSAVALFGAVSGNLTVVFAALVVAGAILGFLRFNTHPARVFMGDAGSQVIGFTLGTLALMVTQGPDSALSAALPLLLLGVPVLDTLVVMVRRIRQGRSPFSSDRQHLHHRLLALGLAHRGAVALIYVAQGGLVLLAWFMRFEPDPRIVVAFVAFATAMWLVLRRAEVAGWHWRDPAAAVPPPAAAASFRAAIAAGSFAVMAVSLIAYSAVAIFTSPPVGTDLAVLCAALLLLLLLPHAWRAAAARVQQFERPLAYLGIVLIVYLEQTAPVASAPREALAWLLPTLAALAAVARFCVSPVRRFEVTSLDLLVVFIALVVPNLPGSSALPANLPAGVAKSVMLLYVVEMLFFADAGRRLPRPLLALAFATIAVRGVFAWAS